jgi:hypothetical protein
MVNASIVYALIQKKQNYHGKWIRDGFMTFFVFVLKFVYCILSSVTFTLSLCYKKQILHA